MAILYGGRKMNLRILIVLCLFITPCAYAISNKTYETISNHRPEIILNETVVFDGKFVHVIKVKEKGEKKVILEPLDANAGVVILKSGESILDVNAGIVTIEKTTPDTNAGIVTIERVESKISPELEELIKNATNPEEIVSVIIILKDQPIHNVSKNITKKYEQDIEKSKSKIKDLYSKGRSRAAEKAFGQSASNKSWKNEEGLDVPSFLTQQEKEEIEIENLNIEGIKQQIIRKIGMKTKRLNEPKQQKVKNKIGKLGGTVTGEGQFYSVVFARVPVKTIEDISTLPEVGKIEKTQILHTQLDTSTSSIYANTFWSNGYLGSPYDVAVADSGIDGTHPALSVYYADVFHDDGQYDSLYDDNPSSTDDLQGHGTHCAGIVASTDSTYKGVAYGLDVLINAKSSWLATDGGGYAYNSDAMKGIDWAIDTSKGDGADVISYSLGGSTSSGDTSMSRFFDAFIDDMGIVGVIAAGNEGPTSETITSPGVSYNAITVGNMDDGNTASRSNDAIASSSSRGPVPGTSRIKPDIVAPGTSIKSAAYDWEGNLGLNPDFVSKSGTSMAAPHISGAAALLMSAGVTDPREIKALLINTAEDYGTSGGDYDYGWGYVDLNHAYTHTSDVRLATLSGSTEYKLYKGYAYSGDLATLVWNRHATYDGASYPTTYYDLSDLDLHMYKESDGSTISSSTSSDENVEQVKSTVDANVVVKAEKFSFASGITSETFALATEEGFTLTTLPSLSISVSNPSRIAPGKDFVVTADVTNNGDITAHNINASLYSLPSGFSIVSGANPQTLGSISSSGTKTATWTVTTTADDDYYTIAATYDSVSYGESYGDIGFGFITVDSIPPAITISSPQNDTYTTTITLNYGVSEATSWEGISVDGGADQSGGNQSITGLNDGPHYITVYANDTAGNMNSATVWFTMDLGVHNLNSGQDYATIQEAINAASVGDTIQVDGGTYNENVDVTKSVNLVGAGTGVTVVNASNPSDFVFYVTADNVNISGLTATGATNSGYAGVYLSGSDHSKIETVNVSNNYYGILLYSSSNNNTLANNTALNNTYGIYLMLNPSNNIIINNTANLNRWHGIVLSSSTNNTITNNNALNNEYGIYLFSSNNNTLIGNTASNNSWGGIYLSDSNSSTLTNNTISSNSWRGIDLHSSSNNNVIYHNNFINNAAKDDGTNVWNAGYTSGGNYWSDWTSPDLNGDGVVDYEYSISGGSNKDRYPVTSPNGWVNIVPDTTPPTIILEIPQNRSYPTGSLDYNISVNELLNWANLSVDNQENLAMFSDSETHYYNLSGTHQTLEEGNHNITFYTQDKFNNTNSTTLYFMVDLTFPEMEYALPTPENGLNTSTNTITINVTHNESYPDTLVLDWNNTNESYSYSGNYTNITKSSLSDGTYSYYVWSNDTAGNSNRTETRTITIDTTPPQITVSRPLQDELFAVSATAKVSYSASDSHLSSVWYSIFNSTTNVTSPENITTDAVYTNSITLLTEGEYIFTVYANDTSGNKISVQINFTINTSYYSANDTTIDEDVILGGDNILANATINGSSCLIDSEVVESQVLNSNITNSIAQMSILTESTLDAVTADNLNMTGTNLTNATVSNALIYNGEIDGTTNAMIELTEEGITINFTNVYENVSLDELITNGNTNDTTIPADNTVTVVSDTTDQNYSVTVDASDTISGKMTAAETPINPGGKSLPNKVSGTKFLFIDAPGFNSSVMRAATIKMKHGQTCDYFSSIKIQRFNESDPTSDWTDLTSWCSGDYIYANTTGFSVFGVSGTIAGSSTPPSGGGGGGGGGSKGASAIVSAKAGEVAKFVFSEAKSEFVSEIALTVKKDIDNAEITVETLEKKPYSTMPDPDDSAYKYIKISTKQLTDDSFDSAEIKFRIEDSWLKDVDIKFSKVALCRNAQNKWNVLITEKTESDDAYVYFKAETLGFSYFAITGEEGSGYGEETAKKFDPALAAIMMNMPKSTKPPETTVAPPIETPPMEEAASVKEEKKGICGPSIVLVIALLIQFTHYLLKRRDGRV